MFISKLPRNRSYHYSPKVYDPEKDEKQKTRDRRSAAMRFQRPQRKNSYRGILKTAILLAMILYVVYYLSQIS